MSMKPDPLNEKQTYTQKPGSEPPQPDDEKNSSPETEKDAPDHKEKVENVGDIHAETVNIIGQFNVNKHGQKEEVHQWAIVDVRKEILKKIKAVFVQSPDYKLLYKNLRHGTVEKDENRVFIVYGPDHVGKFTCAVHLGFDLFGEENSVNTQVKIYKRSIRDTGSLIDFVQSSILSEKTTYIIQDAFENGVDFKDFAHHYLAVINKKLQDKESYLIITTTEQPELDKLQLSKVEAVVEDMPTVFDKHLTRYRKNAESVYVPKKLIELAYQEYKKLKPHFKYPFQIDRFCYELSGLSSEANGDELLKLAKLVEGIGHQPTRSWFQELPDNAKLYAMLVVLFNGVERIMLDEIYALAVKKLRDDGVSILCDSREIGLNDLREKIRAHETEERLVGFETRLFKQEVLRQIHNYHHLLWSLVDMLLELIELFKSPDYWEFRRDLGAAIGRLGISHIRKLKPVLEALARHPNGGVVAVAGYALDEICHTHPEHYAFVTNLLDRWVDSHDPDLMWASGASIWRIYDRLAKSAEVNGDGSLEVQHAEETLAHVQTIFTKLAETFDEFNNNAKIRALANARQLVQGESSVDLDVHQQMRNQLDNWAADNVRSILHAIRMIALTNAENIVELVTSWLQTEDKSSNLHLVGQMASRQLFAESPDWWLLLEERHGPLLKLVGPVLSIDEDRVGEVIDTMIKTLLEWLEHPRWANQIYETLLAVVNRATVASATALRASLSREWLKSDSTKAQEMGQSLIARSYVMAGTPMSMLGCERGIIALDASSEARLNRTSARAGHQLYGHFDPQVETYIVHMGMVNVLVKSGQLVSISELEAAHDRPRLLLHPLEKLVLGLPRAYFVLLLTWGQIVDFDDAWAEPWADRLIVVAVKNSKNSEVKWPEKLSVIPIDSISENNLATVEDKVQARVGQMLAAMEPSEWAAALHEYIHIEMREMATIVAKLNVWVAQLDEIEQAKHRADIARKIVGTVLWLAATNLTHCVEIVRSWLTDDNHELPRLIGVACGKALFRIYANREPVPPVEGYDFILELAPLLAKHSWSGAEAVLYAVRRWAVEPEWLERFLTRPDGGSSELIELVDQVLPKNREALASILKNWTLPLEMEGDEAVPESVKKLAERLQLRMALGIREPLPKLPEGQTYGLIVIDASESNTHAQNRLATLASKVIRELTKRNLETLHLLIYRMGQDYPVAVPGEKPSAETLIPPSLGRRPRLLGPLLEIHSITQVSFVLLLANSAALDSEDWRNTDWHEKIIVYSEATRARWTEYFPLLRKQPNLEKAKTLITNHLVGKIGV